METRRHTAPPGRSPDAVPFRLVSLEVPDAGVVRVLVLAADPLVRAGIASLFVDQPGYRIVGDAAAEEDLSVALATLRPDVVLWDLGAGVASGVDPAEVREADVPLVALLPDETLAAEAWAAGARAFLLRSAPPSLLTAAFLAVQQGLVVVDPALAEEMLPLHEEAFAAPEELTPRECEVLERMAEGLPNKLIADRLGISENTVKFHVSAILSKLGVHSRTEAVIRAAHQGLLVL